MVLPHRLPWRRHLPGSVLAVAFFLLAALLRAYVADILTTALPYGALAAPIGALLFCFFFGMAVLLGAELNATIQARWPAPLRRHDRRRRERRARQARGGGPPTRPCEASAAQSFLQLLVDLLARGAHGLPRWRRLVTGKTSPHRASTIVPMTALSAILFFLHAVEDLVRAWSVVGDSRTLGPLEAVGDLVLLT